MKTIIRLCSLLLLLFICVLKEADADQVKAFVSEIAITGAQNREELKGVLQTLLLSRLNNGSMATVEAKSAADVIISGSYIAFGKIFSLDAVARDRDGKVVARSFVQGDNQEELIPAVGKLAKILSDETVKAIDSSSNPSTAHSPVRKAAPAPGSPPEIIRAEPSAEKKAGDGQVQRITGAMSFLATGRTLSTGEIELYVADNRFIRYYHKGNELKLVAEKELSVGNRIVGLDSADLDNNGTPEVYVTVKTGAILSSQVWEPRGNSFEKVADRLPYFFRAIALGGKEKKMYAQQLSIDEDYYGDVYELVKKDNSFSIINPLKLPKGANIFNFNMFVSKGQNYFVHLSSGGYLVVSTQQGEELWRSSDKFGGSESYFERTEGEKAGWTGSKWMFIDQRITVTPGGAILVPQNAGFWLVGNSRSYSKYSIFAFSWNGATFEELWHTKQSQSYLADYDYNSKKKELLLLEVVQKEGLFSKGASAIVVKKTE